MKQNEIWARFKIEECFRIKNYITRQSELFIEDYCFKYSLDFFGFNDFLKEMELGIYTRRVEFTFRRI